MGWNEFNPPLRREKIWAMQYRKPLISPNREAPEYLACMFTSSLTAALPWLHRCGPQILLALSWAQVALASNYTPMAVMRAMHKAVRRVYSVSPWNAENTMRAVYANTHHQPCAQHVVVTKLTHCLFRQAKWHNTISLRQTHPRVPINHPARRRRSMACASHETTFPQ